MKGFLGNDDLGGFDQQSRLLLLNYTIFLFVSAGVGIFVNLYLWVNSLDINDLIEYQLFSSLTVMPGFLVMLKYASRLRNADIYRLGIVAYILFIATLIVLQEKSVYYSWLLGVESGIAAGFLYAGYNSLTYQEINQKNRILFNSWRSLFSNAVGILAPFVLGFIIVFFNHRGGYLIAYVVLLGILLYQLLNSMKITGNDHKSRIRLGSSFKIAFSNKNYPYIAGADVFWTMTGVIRGIVISIFLFISSGSALIVTSFWVLVASSQMIASFAVRRFMHGKLVSLAGLSNLVNILSSLGIVFYYNLAILAIFGILYGFSSTITGVSYSTASMDVIDTDLNPKENQYHYIIMREYVLVFARLIGFGLTFYLFSRMNLDVAMRDLIVISALLSLATWFVVFAFYRLRGSKRHGHLSLSIKN